MNGLMQHVVTWLLVICFACTCTLHLAVLYFVAFLRIVIIIFVTGGQRR